MALSNTDDGHSEYGHSEYISINWTLHGSLYNVLVKTFFSEIF